MVYYNDIDEFCCEWLECLIMEGAIPIGVVDNRPIQEIKPDDLRHYSQVHLFAGIGGWAYALRLAQWPEDVPVWTGSCPCQPFSVAGKRKGTKDERHLWPYMRGLIEGAGKDADADHAPPVIFGEQVASRDGRDWLSGVRSDLEGVGYAVGAADLCSAGINAPHIRQRLWWVADSSSERRQQISTGTSSDEDENGRTGRYECQPSSHNESSGDGEIYYGLAQSENDGRGQVRENDGGVIERIGEERRSPELGSSGSVSGVEVTNGVEREGQWRFSERRWETKDGIDESGEIGNRLDNPTDSRRSRKGISRTPSSSRLQTWMPESSRRMSSTGFWDSYELLPCLDGKYRRTQPGLRPLAHGVRSRMGKLRGYGNAINPILAAYFIRAFMEAKGMVQIP